MTYPGSGGQWPPNDPSQPPGGPGSGPFPTPGYPPGGYPQQGYPHQGYAQQGYPQQHGYPQQPGYPTQPGFGQPTAYGPPGPPKKSRKGVLIGAIIAVIAIAAGSVVAFWALNRNDVQTGAPDPQAAATLLVSAIGQGDVGGLLSSLAPAEAAILVDLNKDMTEELQRLEVYKQEADPDKLHGAEIKTANLQYDPAAEKVNDHLTITKLVGGTLTIDADASKLPFTKRFLDAAFPDGLDSEPQHEEVDIAKETKNGEKPIRIATVKVDGEWYPSLFYTIADYALADADQQWPAQGIANNGASSPKDALKELAQAAADGNITRVIELLPPDEMGALHDAGPVLVDMAGKTDNAGLQITRFDADTQDVTRGQKVIIREFEATIKGQGSVKVRRDGDCYQVEAEGKSEKVCADQVATMLDSTDSPKISPEAKQALVNLASGMLKNTGIVTTEVDGKWYVSPLRSFTDVELTVLKSLTADDIFALLKLAN